MKYTHISEAVEVKKISEKDNIGVFTLKAFLPVMASLWGMLFRRALLSSLPGSAITQIKIKNIDHEFSTLPGMVEDIVEFTLNLKKVRFHFTADEPQTLKLHVKGEKEVKAEDIESSTLVRVINKDLHLATLSKKSADLDMEITVEKGLGYVMSESRRMERLSVGTIVLDAIFSPVVRVSFHSEDMRVGDRTDYNRLKLEIETDGSISPSEALHKASNILKDHFDKVLAIEVVPAELISGKPEKKKKEK